MKVARQLTLFLLILIAVTAFYGSIQMISDPTGNSLGLPFYLLNGSVFSSFAPSGWILLFTVAIFSTIIVFLIIIRFRYYSFLIMLQGVLLCIFIIIGMLLLGDTFFLQYLFLFFGMALIGLGALQNQRKIAVDAERRHNPVTKGRHHKHRKHH